MNKPDTKKSTILETTLVYLEINVYLANKGELMMEIVF